VIKSPVISAPAVNVAKPVDRNVPPTLALPVTVALANVEAPAPKVPVIDVLPVIPTVPAINVLPVVAFTLNLLVLILKSPANANVSDNVAAPIMPTVELNVVAPVTPNVSVNVTASSTSKVPTIVVLPVVESTVNFVVAEPSWMIKVSVAPPVIITESCNVVTPVTSKVELNVVAPVTPKVELNVVAPVTPNVPPTVVLPEAANVVKAPVEVDELPIGVPSIAPPLISTLAITTEPVPFGVKFKSVFAVVVIIVEPPNAISSTVMSPTTSTEPVTPNAVPSHVKFESVSKIPLAPAITTSFSVNELNVIEPNWKLPAVPETTSATIVASGTNVKLPVLLSKPK